MNPLDDIFLTISWLTDINGWLAGWFWQAAVDSRLWITLCVVSTIWLFTTEEDSLHFELFLQCFNSLHLDEHSTLTDTLHINAVIENNNNKLLS